jgi:hypothetical protein
MLKTVEGLQSDRLHQVHVKIQKKTVETLNSLIGLLKVPSYKEVLYNIKRVDTNTLKKPQANQPDAIF